MSNAEFQRHPRMSLGPEQRSHIAAAYDKAAFDTSLPAYTRVAFDKKAAWFRLLARVGKKKEQAALAKQKAQEPQPNPFSFWGRKATATRVGKALFTGRASSARAKP